MISVGSRDDGRKGLSLRYGVGGENMDLETELEEGEAYFQNNNNYNHNDDDNYNDYDYDDDDDNDDDDDGDSTIDPDVALSYLDEKLQDVLGHFQKDFEGGVSAENLGAKFGGYGSFLPSYQRSPACPNRTPPKASTNNSSISMNDLFIEGGRQSSVSISNASQSTRHGPVSTSGTLQPPLRGPLMNGKVKQEMNMSSSSKASDKFTSYGPPVNNKFANSSDPTSLKVRIKVGSDNLSTKKKAEIYSGLGLDVSPTSSLEASPVDSDDFCHVPHDTPHEESPTSILEMMTSFPVLGGLLLSPLANDLLYLTEKEKWEGSSCGSVHKQSQESTFTVNKSDSKVDRNKKIPKAEDSFASVEPINGNNVKKEAGINNSSCEKGNVLDFRKDAAFKSELLSVVPKEESLDPVLTHDDFRVKKPYKKDGLVGNANSDEKFISFPTKSDSDVSKGGKIVDSGLVKPPKYEKDGMKLPTSSSGGKKKSKGSQSLENGVHSVEISKTSLKNDSSSKNRNNTFGSKVEDLKNNNGKARETYKDFFGELDAELEDADDIVFEEKPKEYKGTEKGTLESNVSSKEIINGRKGPKPSSSVYPAGRDPISGPVPHIAAATGNGVPVSDAPSATVAAVVNEDWVCCDKCEKWRLLPPGVNPGRLPEKWLCSMLDWLPGMNKCSISQEETTKALTTQFLVPAPTVHGLQPTVHPGAPQSGVMSVDPLHPDQRRQPFGPQTVAKKKHGTKDLPNEPKQERPSLSSNSAKKNLQPSNKTISLNGANQSPFVNEVDFQDSGQSSSLIAEKHRFKHKEKKKHRENFVDEGNNDLKIRNKRETSQDCSRDSKKVKTDNNNGTVKDRVSDQEGAVSKTINTSVNDLTSRKDHQKYDDRSKDSKSASKPSSINPKSQNGKRKSNEIDGDQIEETSETGQRKGKKVQVPESQEEGKGKLLDSSRRDLVVHASLAATSSSSKVSGSHKTKNNNQEIKGSPVESVSSSPLRILNPDKLTSSRRNTESADNYQSNTFRKEVDLVESLEKAVIVPSVEFETEGVKQSFQVHNVEKRNDDQSHSRSRKNGKGSSSRSREKNRTSKSDNDKNNLKISERTTENSDIQEKSKGGRNRSQEKPSINPDKYEKGAALKKESSGKPLSIPDVKQNISKQDMPGRGKPHSLPLPLPPSGKGQNGQNDTSRPPQPFAGSQKENKGNNLLNDGVEGGDALKSSKQKKKAENQNGNHPTPNRHKGTPSPLRRESSSQAASAIKEAKALKHMADRLKNSGSNHESNSLYFQAALKFLYGSCLLESSYTENGKHGDMLLSLDMYRSTAKLCEYVAHEYEKSKEMAAAALAYKLAEVAYLKVVYSSHANASKDRQELQTTLTGPTGESPSSSASDIDNLNNPTAVDKAPVPKGVNDPQVGGNHVISARNKPNFMRILNFAQDVNFAMEASRRSQMAFAASGSQPEHAHHKEVIKPALDFNFQDIEGLLHLVRVAMEVISR